MFETVTLAAIAKILISLQIQILAIAIMIVTYQNSQLKQAKIHHATIQMFHGLQEK